MQNAKMYFKELQIGIHICSLVIQHCEHVIVFLEYVEVMKNIVKYGVICFSAWGKELRKCHT
jgi:hypothetical protein